LTVPAVIQVVDKLPLLGSGKTGYVAATALARESGRQSGSAPEQEVA
jgi:acyl-[acyl-carrier-protein]-phospholipid O-acyltransferase/long-chain-fatty-acid--[acyl-carrier-protein] ligase